MTPSSLPNREQAWVEEVKIKDYLLNLDHPVGGSKAKFFLGRGFTAAAWDRMVDALCHHAKHNFISNRKVTPFATNFSLDCSLPTPDKSAPCIRTVWEIRPNDPRPRLITAYPLGLQMAQLVLGFCNRKCVKTDILFRLGGLNHYPTP